MSRRTRKWCAHPHACMSFVPRAAYWVPFSSFFFQLSSELKTSERGMFTLCNALVAMDFLEVSGEGKYELTGASRAHLLKGVQGGESPCGMKFQYFVCVSVCEVRA